MGVGDNGDRNCYSRLLLSSHEVEITLGRDNIVYGVRIGPYHLQNAPLLPLAIRELDGRFGYGGYLNTGSEIAAAIESTLIRHIGRRQARSKNLRSDYDNLIKCIILGWNMFVSIPISILQAFGIMNESKGNKIRDSIFFRLWSLISALVAVIGVIIAYLADRDAIHGTINQILP